METGVCDRPDNHRNLVVATEKTLDSFYAKVVSERCNFYQSISKRAHKVRKATSKLASSQLNSDSRNITYQTQTYDHANPKHDIIQQLPLPYPRHALNHHKRHLHHHEHEAVAPKLSRNAAHNQLMRKSGDEERDTRCDWPR